MSESAHNTNSTSSSSKDASHISINLDALSSIDDMPPESLIFSHLHTILVDKIRAVAAKNLEEKSKQDIGSRACFFIDGTRGSGKSTLMRAVRKKLTSDKTKEENKISIVSLADIDPTELAKGENFLMYILGKIHHIADEFSQKHALETDRRTGNYQEAMECIRRMSGGLHLILDAENSLLKSDDPEYFIEESVEKCASSSELRTNLNKLLENACAMVGADVFLITVDDADMNFSKCVSVLEYVRKYMHSPRLIFLFAGDMQLYTHVVRGMQIDNFEQKLFDYDTTQQTNRIEMLDRLEDQYLLKFFPVDNRVSLGSFSELISREREVTLQHLDAQGNLQETTLDMLLYEKLRLITEALYIPIMKQFIGTLPLRSALSMLKLWISGEEVSTDTIRAIADGIQRVALQNLIKRHVNYAELPNSSMPVLLNAIIHHMVTPELNCSHQDLLPRSDNIDLCFPSFYLSAEIAHHTKTHAAKLIYLCTLFPNWYTIESAYHQEQDPKQKATVLHQQEQDTLSYIQNTGTQESRAHVTDCMALYNENSSGTPYGFGTLRLLKKGQKLNKEKGTEKRHSVFGLLQMLAKLSHLQEPQDTAESQQRMVCLALLHSISGVTVGKSPRYYLSIFNLLLLAAELLEMNFPTKDLQQKVTERITSGYLPCSVRYHSKEDMEDELYFGAKDSFATIRNSFGHFSAELLTDDVKSICAWIEKFRGCAYISTAKALQLCWNEFCARCETNTSEYQPEYNSPNIPPNAGTLLIQYMNAFESAISTHISLPETDNENQSALTLKDCIIEFPLWAALKKAKNETVFRFLNDTHIVPLKNKTYIQEFEKKSKELKEAQSFAAKQENDLRDKKADIAKQRQILIFLNSDLTHINHEEDQARKEKEKADAALLDAQKRLDSLDAEKKRLQETLNNLEQQHNTCNVQQNMALQVNLQHLNTNTNQLAELENLKQRIDKKHEELAAAEKEYQNEHASHKRMRMEFICFTLRRELHELESRNANLRQVQAGTQKELSDSQREYEKMKRKCMGIIEELNRTRAGNTQVSSKRERAYTELEMCRVECEQKQKKLQQILIQKQEFQAKRQAHNDNIEQMEAQQQEMIQVLEKAHNARDAAQAALNLFRKGETV